MTSGGTRKAFPFLGGLLPEELVAGAGSEPAPERRCRFRFTKAIARLRLRELCFAMSSDFAGLVSTGLHPRNRGVKSVR